MTAKRNTATITINLTYDMWRDLEGALLDRAAQASDHPAMRDRLNTTRQAIEAQVREQKPRWR